MIPRPVAAVEGGVRNGDKEFHAVGAEERRECERLGRGCEFGEVQKAPHWV